MPKPTITRDLGIPYTSPNCICPPFGARTVESLLLHPLVAVVYQASSKDVTLFLVQI